jgi:hypothetical protein
VQRSPAGLPWSPTGDHEATSISLFEEPWQAHAVRINAMKSAWDRRLQPYRQHLRDAGEKPNLLTRHSLKAFESS